VVTLFSWALWVRSVGAQICPTNFLAVYDILVLVWLVTSILVEYSILPTILTFPSQILPTFWPTWGQGSLTNILASQWLPILGILWYQPNIPYAFIPVGFVYPILTVK
jgi:hypothetical protein